MLSMSGALYAHGAGGTAGGFISMMPSSGAQNDSGMVSQSVDMNRPTGGFIQMMPRPHDSESFRGYSQRPAGDSVATGGGFIYLMQRSNGTSAFRGI